MVYSFSSLVNNLVQTNIIISDCNYSGLTFTFETNRYGEWVRYMAYDIMHQVDCELNIFKHIVSIGIIMVYKRFYFVFK